MLKAVNVTRNRPLAGRVEPASDFWKRLIGLMGRSRLADGAGMYIRPCRSVHTFFMRFPIDILFLDAGGKVLHGRTLRPWRMSRWVRRADGVLELPADTLKRTGTEIGDRIALRPASAGKERS